MSAKIEAMLVQAEFDMEAAQNIGDAEGYREAKKRYFELLRKLEV